MPMKNTLSAALAVAALLPAAPALADDDIATAIHGRIAHYRELGTAFKAIDDELKHEKPYEPALREAADHIADMSLEVPRWFPPGSGPAPKDESWGAWIKSFFVTPPDPRIVHGVKTKASADIWLKPEEFKTDYTRLQVESAKLLELLQAKDMDGFKAQFDVLKKACDTCHTSFRHKDDL